MWRIFLYWSYLMNPRSPGLFYSLRLVCLITVLVITYVFCIMYAETQQEV